MLKRKSRRFYLPGLPALLLGAVLWMHSRLPRPASPADVWLWEAGEKIHKLTIQPEYGADSDKLIGLKHDVQNGLDKGIILSDDQAICDLLRAWNCSTPWTNNFNTKIYSSIARHGIRFYWGKADSNIDSFFLIKAGNEFYLVRPQRGAQRRRDTTSCELTPESTSHAFQLLRRISERAQHKDPKVRLYTRQFTID